MLIQNAIHSEENDIAELFNYIDNTIGKTKSNTGKYREIVKKLSNNFYQIYNIVYSIELALTVILIFITHKYDDLVD